MSMQTTAARALTHIIRAGQNNPQIYLVVLPVLAAAGAVYGACKLADYVEQKQADKTQRRAGSQARRSSLRQSISSREKTIL